MKKTAALTTVFVLGLATVGLCAVPNPNAGIGDVQFGYNHYELKKTAGGVDHGKKGFDEVYANVGLGLGYGVFINHAASSETSYTDYGLQTSLLIPNVSLMAGQRHMSTDNMDSDNSLFYGAAVRQPLGGGVAVYATYQNGTDFKDESVGLTYSLNKNAQLDVSWKRYDDNNGAHFKGLGAGVNFKF